MESLESVWKYREETLYREMFGAVERGIFPLSADIFTRIFQQPDIDPRWLFLGVFEFRPSTSRSSWLYVT